MKRPAFQFYPDNWRNNSNLRRCSWAARGVWVEVMCLLHDSDRYGALAWSLKEIAQALGCPISLLKELVEKGVMKGCDAGDCEPYIYTPRSGRRDGDPVTLIASQKGPLWYSSRMVRDEYVRTNAGASTRFGTKGSTKPEGDDASTPTPRRAPSPSPSLRHGEGQGDGSSTPSSSSYADSSLRSESAAAAAAPEPVPVRDLVWRDGTPILQALTGKSDRSCRSFLGTLLKAANDDHALVLSALRAAEERQPADAFPWLRATVAKRQETAPAEEPIPEEINGYVVRAVFGRVLDELDVGDLRFPDLPRVIVALLREGHEPDALYAAARSIARRGVGTMHSASYLAATVRGRRNEHGGAGTAITQAKDLPDHGPR